MAPTRRLSQLVEDPGRMRSLVEKFNYLDANHDGSISIEELQEVYKMFDPVRGRSRGRELTGARAGLRRRQGRGGLCELRRGQEWQGVAQRF